MTASAYAPLLVADIGGTNARFALAGAGPALTAISEYSCSQFESLALAIRHYLAQGDAGEIRRAVVAVACPVTGDHVKITNNPWSFSIEALRHELGLAQLDVINDFAAVGYAVPQLSASDLHAIGGERPGAPRGADRHYAVLGPGTGLGVGGLILRGDETVVIETEGGHVGFAPGDDYEIEILRQLLKKHARISAERLISGPGLVNLHEAVCAIEGVAAEHDTPAAITASANDTPDSICARTVERFCALLGSFAGDIVLAHGAWDGLYLAGGITPRLLPWIERGSFRQRFEAKGRFRELLHSIPTRVITHAHVGLLGAATRGLNAR